VIFDDGGGDWLPLTIARRPETEAPHNETACEAVERVRPARVGDPAVARTPIRADPVAHRDRTRNAGVAQDAGVIAVADAAANALRRHAVAAQTGSLTS